MCNAFSFFSMRILNHSIAIFWMHVEAFMSICEGNFFEQTTKRLNSQIFDEEM